MKKMRSGDFLKIKQYQSELRSFEESLRRSGRNPDDYHIQYRFPRQQARTYTKPILVATPKER